MDTPEYISNFIEVVYPEMTALCTTVNTEKTTIKQATLIIKGYRSALRAIAEMKIGEMTNCPEMAALCIAIAKTELTKTS